MKDRIGEKYNRLTIISFDRKGKSGNTNIYYWLCRCECGNEKSVRYNNLQSNQVRSCGCLANEILVKRVKTHGMTKTSEYKSWCHLIERCENPNYKLYKDYGGRGIKVSEEWKNSFQQFYNDVGPKPSKFHSIDRIDNDGDYCKENCKWSTRKEQNNNKRSNLEVIDTITGKIYKTISEAAEDNNLKNGTLRQYLIGARKNITNLKLTKTV